MSFCSRGLAFASALGFWIMLASARSPDGGPSLKDAAHGRFRVGVAIRSAQLDRPEAVDLILHQFDCLTAEYEFMPQILQPSPGKFNFQPADRIAKFAHAHGLPLTGHMLVWHLMTPAWMFEDSSHKPLSRDEALANLKAHIDAVVRHFKGKVESWNVVNEAISDNPSEYLRDTPALRAIGPDYVLKAFEFAHAADPAVPLYYNDYNVEDPKKLPKVLRLVRSLRSAGVRLDSIGIQGHWLLDYPSPRVIDEGITALAHEGLKVIVSELDVDVVARDGSDPYKAGLPVDIQDREAKRYGDLFEVFVKHRSIVPRITFWGLDDGQSWLNYTPKTRTNYPLLFDRNLNPKPPLEAIIGVLTKK